MAGSPMFEDIKKVVPLISQEDYLHFFRRRLEDIVVATLADGFEVIVVDHSPGLFGFSSTSLDMMLDQVKPPGDNPTRLTRLMQIMGKTGRLSVAAALVTTPDRVDHAALISSLSYMLEDKSFDEKSRVVGDSVVLINNKATPKEGEIFDPAFAMQRIYQNLDGISKKRQIKRWVIDALLKKTRETGAIACEYIGSFDMEKIILTVERLKGSEKDTGPGMERWCRQVGETFGILEPRMAGRP
jgi:hypothetical protein